jgi:hypothetical protein
VRSAASLAEGWSSRADLFGGATLPSTAPLAVLAPAMPDPVSALAPITTPTEPADEALNATFVHVRHAELKVEV